MVKVLTCSVVLAVLAQHVFAQHEIATNPSDPTLKHIEYWEKKGYCHREYFSITRQNMVDSGVEYARFRSFPVLNVGLF
jgi:hypothetical protein